MGNDLVDQAQGFTEFSDAHAAVAMRMGGCSGGPSSQMNFRPSYSTLSASGTRSDDIWHQRDAVMYAPGRFSNRGAQAYSGANDVLQGR
jgi:hypothetical protein